MQYKRFSHLQGVYDEIPPVSWHWMELPPNCINYPFDTHATKTTFLQTNPQKFRKDSICFDMIRNMKNGVIFIFTTIEQLQGFDRVLRYDKHTTKARQKYTTNTPQKIITNRSQKRHKLVRTFLHTICVHAP